MKKNIEIDISIKFRKKSTAVIIAKSLDPDNKDFPEGLTTVSYTHLTLPTNREV